MRLKAGGFLKYLWPFNGHEALNGRRLYAESNFRFALSDTHFISVILSSSKKKDIEVDANETGKKSKY